MRHIALPRLRRERKELSVNGACGLPSMGGQYAQTRIMRGLYCPRLPVHVPPSVGLGSNSDFESIELDLRTSPVLRKPT